MDGVPIYSGLVFEIRRHLCVTDDLISDTKYVAGRGMLFPCAKIRYMVGRSKCLSINNKHLSYMIWTHSWWRHQMETFSALLAICAGNSPVTGEFPAQRPVTRSFDVFIDLRLNIRLSKQWWGWWYETPSRSLWRHCNAAVLWFIYIKVTLS